MRVTTYSLDTNAQYLASQRALQSVQSGILAQSNGTTNYGKVNAGTVLARNASTQLVHPAGHQELSAVITAANAASVLDAANFYVGDLVSLYDSESGTYDGVTVAAGDDPSDLTLAAVALGNTRISYQQIEHSYDAESSDDGTEIYHRNTDDGTDDLIQLYLAMEQDQHEIDVADDGGGNTQGVIFTAREAGNSRIRVALVDHVYDRDHAPALYHTRDDDGTFDDVVFHLQMGLDSHEWEVANDGGGNTADMLVTATSDGDSRISVKITDPGGNSLAEKLTITDDGTDVLLDVSCSTGGGGAITSTVQTVMNILEGSGLVLCALGAVAGTGSAAQVVVATAATDIDDTTDGSAASLTTAEVLKDYINGHPSLMFTGADGTAAGTGSMADVCSAEAATGIDGTTSGADVATTVAEIAAYINGTLDHKLTANTVETPTDLGATLAATPLTGGSAAYGALASARTVTIVDKTSSPNLVTFNGGAITAPIGAHLVKDGLHVPVGISDLSVTTIEYIDSTLYASDRDMPIRYEGDLREGQIVGLSTWLKLALTGAPIVDIADSGALVLPEHAGFTFQYI